MGSSILNCICNLQDLYCKIYIKTHLITGLFEASCNYISLLHLRLDCKKACLKCAILSLSCILHAAAVCHVRESGTVWTSRFCQQCCMYFNVSESLRACCGSNIGACPWLTVMFVLGIVVEPGK